MGIAREKTTDQPTSKANKIPKQQQKTPSLSGEDAHRTDQAFCRKQPNQPAHLLFQALSAAELSLQKNSDTHYAPGLSNCQYQKVR